MVVYQDTFIVAGSSNIAAYLSKFYSELLPADYTRYYTKPLPTLTTPNRPILDRLPNRRVFTMRRPYADVETTPVVSGSSTTSFVIAPSVAPSNDSWLFIRLAGQVNGLVRRIVNYSAGTVTLDGANPLPSIPAAGDSVVLLHESHTISTVDTIGGAPRKGITKTGSSANFAMDVGDKWIVFFNGTNSDTPPEPNFNEARRIRSRIDATSVELYDALGATDVPLADQGFVVLMGANAVHDLAGITQANSELRNIQVALDRAPCFFDGFEYMNWDQGTTFASPRAIHTEPTFNSLHELAWHLGAQFVDPLVFIEAGVSSSMISPFPFANSTPHHDFSWAWDFTNNDFDPSSPNSCWTMLINSIDATRAHIEAEGKRMRVAGIFMNISDNDPGDLQRIFRLGENIAQFRDTLRDYVGSQKIPFVTSGPSAYGFNFRPLIYRQLRALAKNDPWTGLVDTRANYPLAADNLHFAVQAQLRLAQDYFGCWKATRARGQRLAA